MPSCFKLWSEILICPITSKYNVRFSYTISLQNWKWNYYSPSNFKIKCEILISLLSHFKILKCEGIWESNFNFWRERAYEILTSKFDVRFSYTFHFKFQVRISYALSLQKLKWKSHMPSHFKISNEISLTPYPQVRRHMRFSLAFLHVL